jgi:hypothetical protein
MAQLRQPERALVADLGRGRIEREREIGAREREVEQRERVEARVDLGRGAAADSESSRSTRATSRSTSSSARLCWLLRSTSACGSTNSVVPEPDASCTMPRIWPRLSARTGST